MSPRSMKVAVRSRAQHSWMLGHRASSQTVTSERRRIIARTSSYSPVVLARTLSHSGRSRRDAAGRTGNSLPTGRLSLRRPRGDVAAEDALEVRQQTADDRVERGRTARLALDRGDAAV